MFDFVRDPEFRKSLEDDYAEMNVALSQKSWKTVQVFAGSLIEAVLIDYLISINFQPDPTKLDLAKAVNACEQKGLLSPETVKLTDVLRNYRNLIHPGRAIRLKENADEHKASIAKALVAIILESVSRKFQTVEFTAEQIISKMEDDPSALAILDHLLDASDAVEIDRLINSALPKRYFQLLEDGPNKTIWLLEKLFRHAFERAPFDSKQKFVKHLAKIIKTGNEHTVFNYEVAFFRGADLQYVEYDMRVIIIAHLLGRIRDSVPNSKLMVAIDGIERFLNESQLNLLCNSLLNWVASPFKDHRTAAYSGLVRLLKYSQINVGSASVADLAESQIRDYTAKSYDQSLGAMQLLQKLRLEPDLSGEISDEDIPF